MKLSRICAVCVVLFVCLALGCDKGEDVGSVSWSSSASSAVSSEVSSIASSSDTQTVYLCEDDDNDYYLNYTSFGYELYRQNKTKHEKTLIRSEKFMRSLTLSGDWLYYIAEDQNICRIKKNGEEHSVVLNCKQFQEYEDEPIRSFCVVDNVLFVQMNFGFYKYDMLTNTVRLIDSDVSIYHIIDNRLYFIGHARSDFTVYVKNLETDETKILLGDGVYARDKESMGFPL